MEKRIRFIDSSYNELFTVPDGSMVVVCNKDSGAVVAHYKAEFIDDYHLYLTKQGFSYKRCFHICEFAEMCEQNGYVCKLC